MRFLSVSSGIEAASVAWNPLGWEAVGFSEIEPFPCAVLKHHYPHVPNFGDMTQFETWPDANTLRPDLLCGGTPCQSFSVAGLRQGLDDPRGNLMLTFGAIAARYRPRWLVWENVPGVLSSNGGRDFAAFLGLLTGQTVEPPEEGWKNSGILSGYASAYGVAWRVLDAQHFGVPQRRRRVFVIGYLGDWRRAAAVLFERESLRRDPPPSRQPGERTAGTLTKGAIDGSPCGGDGRDSFLIDVCPTVSSKWAKGSGGPSGDECQNLLAVAPPLTSNPYGDHESREGLLVAASLDASYGRLQGCSGQDLNHGHSHLVAFNPQAGGKQTSLGYDPRSGTTGTLEAHQTPAIAFAIQERAGAENLTSGPQGKGFQEGIAYTLEARNKVQSVATTAVRRLTPRECERLQDFPDDYTAIPWRGKPADQCPDGPRYKALGNSWATCVPHWLGTRIAAVDLIP